MNLWLPAQVVIKAALFVTVMYLILEAINYYYIMLREHWETFILWWGFCDFSSESVFECALKSLASLNKAT